VIEIAFPFGVFQIPEDLPHGFLEMAGDGALGELERAAFSPWLLEKTGPENTATGGFSFCYLGKLL